MGTGSRASLMLARAAKSHIAGPVGAGGAKMRRAPDAETTSVVLADIVDDLAVVGQLAGGVKRNFAAELGDLADRRNDRLGDRRSVVGHFDVQGHAVDALRIVDDESPPDDLRVPA